MRIISSTQMMSERCCCDCGRKMVNNYSYYINKKSLVAASLLVLVMLHASTTEAAPRPEHRRRHQRKMAVEPKLYREAMEKISTRLTHTKNCFRESMKLLNESREHVNGNPRWLPKVNFVSIHHHNKGGMKTRFRLLAPKLYTHLVEYRVIFDLLLNVTSLSADDDYHELIVRRKVLESIKIQLDSSVTDVIDSMESVNMTPPPFDASQMQLRDFAREVDKTKRYLQDRIAYRGYSNLLRNWLNEFKCWRKRQGRMSAVCATHRSMLNKRKEIKERKTRTQ